MDPTRAGLEAALAADPDDLVTHAAYADYLSERGDPRGDFIRLQLALEDRSQPADRLRAMESEAYRLRQRHAAEWLGPLYAFENPVRAGRPAADPDDSVDVQYRRGWVHRLRVRRLSPELCEAARKSPHLPLLAELEVGADGLFGHELDGHCVARLLDRSSLLTHLDLSGQSIDMTPVIVALPATLQSLRLTCNTVYLGEGILAAGRVFPALRLLHLELQDEWDFLYEWGSLIRRLADPAVLPALESLSLRLPNFGDAGVITLLETGLVGRLKGLDLCRCQITDDGAQALAADPAVPRLDALHLDDNYLSPIGIQALADVGVTVSERQRFGPGDAGDDDPPDDVAF